MADTLRDQIAEAIKLLFTNMKKGLPTTDPYDFTWSIVSREPISKLPAGKANAIGIYDVEETKNPLANSLIDCTLRFVIEFHLHVNSGEKSATMLNLALGNVQRVLMADQSLGGLVIDLIEERSEFDIDGQYDKQVEGSLFLTVRYRHNISDPRSAL